MPELVWAALLLISAGLGPLAGTLALALHTTGVLGRLFAESIENAPRASRRLLQPGLPTGRVFLYATFAPGAAAARLPTRSTAGRTTSARGGHPRRRRRGRLGQMLAFHMGLFQMGKTASVLAAMLVLVALVDGLSALARRLMSR